MKTDFMTTSLSLPTVGPDVGDTMGKCLVDGFLVGPMDGEAVGSSDGHGEGSADGRYDGSEVGSVVGIDEG